MVLKTIRVSSVPLKKEFGMSPKEFKELSVKTQEKQG